MSEKEICQEALKTYGMPNQLIVAIEELSELQKEICKYLRGKGDMQHIAEEVADVEIMIEQLTMAFNIRADVIRWRRKKFERLSGRMKHGEESFAKAE